MILMEHDGILLTSYLYNYGVLYRMYLTIMGLGLNRIIYKDQVRTAQ